MHLGSRECFRCRGEAQHHANQQARRERYADEIRQLEWYRNSLNDLEVDPDWQRWSSLYEFFDLDIGDGMERRRQSVEARLRYLNRLCGYAA
jgi:hypothetical protein